MHLGHGYGHGRSLLSARVASVIRALKRFQLRWGGPLAFLSPPSIRRALVILAYCAFITILSVSGVLADGAGSHEPWAFRLGWLSLAQTPLIFLLVARPNPVSFLTGISYERLNWLHRWLCVIFIAVATTHGALFIDPPIRKGTLATQLDLVPQTVDGILAWGLMVWILISSMVPLRRLSHELFILQHLVLAAAFLYVILRHVGKKNKLLVWVSIMVFAFDFAARTILVAFRNIKPQGLLQRSRGRGMKWFGYTAEVTPLNDDMTTLVVHDIGFSWEAGQHVYIWSPRFPLQTPHPFTILEAPGSDKGIRLVMQTKKGFTRRLNHLAKKLEVSEEKPTLRLFMTGPFGHPPDWERYDTVLLVSASTGASFTIPILASLVESPAGFSVRKISLLLITRRRHHLELYLHTLKQILATESASRISIDVLIAVTGSRRDLDPEKLQEESTLRLTDQDANNEEEEDQEEEERKENETDTRSNTSLDIASTPDSEADTEEPLNIDEHEDIPLRSTVRECSGRPDLGAFVREATMSGSSKVKVAICGGEELAAGVCDAVTALTLRCARDGTVCPDISVHVEEFGM